MFQKNIDKKSSQKKLFKKNNCSKKLSKKDIPEAGNSDTAGTSVLAHGVLGAVEVVAFSGTMRPEKVSSHGRRTSRLS